MHFFFKEIYNESIGAHSWYNLLQEWVPLDAKTTVYMVAISLKIDHSLLYWKHQPILAFSMEPMHLLEILKAFAAVIKFQSKCYSVSTCKKNLILFKFKNKKGGDLPQLIILYPKFFDWLVYSGLQIGRSQLLSYFPFLDS